MSLRYESNCTGCGRLFLRPVNSRSGRCHECLRQASLDRLRRLNGRRKAEAAENRALMCDVCWECGEPMIAARSTRRFCSDRCRQRSHRGTQDAAP
jgi:hypothetical protein